MDSRPISPITYLPTTVPVFCTADIPIKTLETFLAQCLERADESTWVPHIVTSTTLPSGEDTLARTTTPIAPFTSPFVGKTATEVNAQFLELIAPLDRGLVTQRLFVILDEQTTENDSCLIVHGGKYFDPEDELSFLRTDFYVAMNMVSRAEMGVTELGENLSRDRIWGVDNLIED